MEDIDASQEAGVFRALADSTRRQILEELGYGAGYRYAHAFEDAYAPQEYLPEVLRGRKWYEPTEFGLEKDINSFNISYDPENHEAMSKLRKAKVDGIIREIPPTKIEGPETGDLLVFHDAGAYGASMSSNYNTRPRAAEVMENGSTSWVMVVPPPT